MRKTFRHHVAPVVCSFLSAAFSAPKEGKYASCCLLWSSAEAIFLKSYKQNKQVNKTTSQMWFYHGNKILVLFCSSVIKFMWWENLLTRLHVRNYLFLTINMILIFLCNISKQWAWCFFFKSHCFDRQHFLLKGKVINH